MAKRKAVIKKGCVACGYCVKQCPLQIISIPLGIIAVINQEKCVGCGKCEKVCPAGVIVIKELTEEEYA